MPESDLDFLIWISVSALAHPTIATENPVRSNMALISIEYRGFVIIEQNKNYVNSWLHGALNGARSVIANFEGRDALGGARRWALRNSVRSSIEKARDRFPGAGLESCDALNVPVICPTCQISEADESLRSLTYSRP